MTPKFTRFITSRFSAIGSAPAMGLVVSLSFLLGACNAADGSPELDQPDEDTGPVAWNQPVVVAEGDAYAGPWRMNDSEFRYVDDATANLREDGSAVVVWVDNESQDVFLQKYNAEDQPQLSEAVNVSRSPDIFSWLPRVVFTNDDQVFVLWQEIVFSGGSHGGEIFFARSVDGGASFEDPINLSQTIAGAGKGRLNEESWDNGSLDILRGHSGEIFVAWTEYQGRLHFRRSLDGGSSFEPPVHVAGSDDQPLRAPSLAQAADGTIYLAWARGEDDSADIQVALSYDGGQSFSEARPVQQSGGHSDVPAVIADTNGTVHMVYAESPNGRFSPGHIAYTRLGDDGRAAIEPRLISGDNRTHGARAPAIGLDQQGNVVVVWENKPDPDERAKGLGYTVSTDSGQTFNDPNIVPGTLPEGAAVNGSLQGQLAVKLSVNSQGGIMVTNSHFDLGSQSQIFFVRGRIEN